MTEAFHLRHATLYGHRLPQAVELVTLRVKVHSPAQALHLQAAETMDESLLEVRRVRLAGIDAPVPVYARETLPATIHGPALITETVSTTYVASGWSCRRDTSGCLLLSR